MIKDPENPPLNSNRVNKGTHIATKRAQLYSKQYKYVLKCDIRKYFPCIDHEILKKIIRKKIKCSSCGVQHKKVALFS